MSLERGTKLGAYEILEPLGAGGMGEVYRAKDTRIDRTVAVKVLPAGLADDEGLKQRFEREAKSISSLNHPHICTLYEFDHHDGADFLVMEHLEGESLAERLAKKVRLPLDEALKIALQIAEALDSAHRQGVVHRDLKPGNIMLTASGAKLLDFGLAKLAAPGGPDLTGLSALPTQAQPLTEQGAILGTFQYMAPEQLEGKEADARTDVFAFGAVVYEMITGRKAFEGKSQASLIGAILERQPEPVSSLQPLAPVEFDRIVKKCLAKDPAHRYYTMHDLADELRWMAEAGAPVAATDKGPAGRSRLVLATGFLLGALVAGMALFALIPEPSPPQAARFAVVLPPDQRVEPGGMMNIALAPDGSRFAYRTNDQIYVRELDQLEARPLSGTEGQPRSPVFSPDGEWIAFWDGGQLKKISVLGGAPLTLSEVTEPQGVSWGEDDVLRMGAVSGGIWEVPGSGGPPRSLLSETKSVWKPQLLPDGRTYLLTQGNSFNPDDWLVLVKAPEDDAPRVVFEGADEVRYLPTGHLLLHVAGDNLLAVPFDLSRLELAGAPVPVVENASWQFDVAPNGALLYLPLGMNANARLVWVDRNGDVVPAVNEAKGFRRPRLAPDGRRVAVEITTAAGSAWHVWVYDLERGTRTRVTADAENGQDSVWTLDGGSLVFGSSPDLYRRSADGSGEAELLLEGDVSKDAHSFSPDGRLLAFYERRGGNRDIYVVELEGDGDPEPFVVTEFNERSPVFSPDGRYLAYVSDASGGDEIYVQAYPGPGARTVVSTDGGVDPMWSPDGQELFYRQGDRMMVVPVETDPRFSSGIPEVLFEGTFQYEPNLGSGSHTYDVSPDGERFLMVEATEDRSEIHIVLNWLQELEARVPGAR